MKSLTLLTTPIGNLSDITDRAKDALKSSEYIICEDTRVCHSLLDHLGISKDGKYILSYGNHSNEKDLDHIFKKMEGKDVYLVSDAGSPVISDPAYPLVKRALADGVSLQSIPGVSAVTLALELSGLPAHPFVFHGFLERAAGKQKDFFLETQVLAGTHIFFESPHRVKETLDVLTSQLPEAQISVGRELTKKFEQVLRFNAKDWPLVKQNFREQGEFVVVYYLSKENQSLGSTQKIKELAQEVLERPGTKNLAKLLAEVLGRETKEIYQELSQNTKN
jgi:16S rRNA (cytidine1402-2'-O)-methyltransferase